MNRLNFIRIIALTAISPNILSNISSASPILIRKMTSCQRDVIVNPINGMVIYNSTTCNKNLYDNGRWKL